jgi:hypothetical protein
VTWVYDSSASPIPILTSPIIRGLVILLFAMRDSLKIFCAVILLCVLGMAADHWNKGTVLQYRQNTFTTDTSRDETGHTIYSLAIDGGDRIYFVEKTLNFAWQKVPTLTENGVVEWRLKGKDMLIRDDKGKEFAAPIVETRLKE